MTLDQFIAGFAEQFEDTAPEEFTTDTEFKELDEWDSLTALTIIGYVKTNYGKTITGAEVRGCTTIKDLFDLVESK